jgi:hypothetical protein
MKRNRSDTSRRDLLTAKNAAALLPGASSYQSLLRWARQGKVPFVRLPSGRMFFRRSDIEALLAPVEPGSGERDAAPFADVPLPGFSVQAVSA